MNADPSSANGSDQDEEVTLAASDRTVQEIQAEAKRDRGELSVWTTDDDQTTAAPPRQGGRSTSANDKLTESAADSSIADEPTVIRGFGEDSTTPLVESRGASLIDGLDPPQSETSFFQLDEMAPKSHTASRSSTGGRRFPVAVFVLALLVVVVTVTIVLAILLGSSA